MWMELMQSILGADDKVSMDYYMLKMYIIGITDEENGLINDTLNSHKEIL